MFKHPHVKLNGPKYSQKVGFTFCLFASISTLYIIFDKSQNQALVYHPLHYGQ